MLTHPKRLLEEPMLPLLVITTTKFLARLILGSTFVFSIKPIPNFVLAQMDGWVLHITRTGLLTMLNYFQMLSVGHHRIAYLPHGSIGGLIIQQIQPLVNRTFFIIQPVPPLIENWLFIGRIAQCLITLVRMIPKNMAHFKLY